MIQRIQSVYLLLVFTLQLVAIFVLKDWITASGSFSSLSDQPFLYAGIIAAAFLSVFSLLKYKTRKLQFVLNRLNSLIHLVILLVFVIRVFSITDSETSRPFSLFLPALTIGLLYLANKAIKKDEDLIRSVDRIR
jgi:hypothetical protein